ncbi:uncharacterized protein LOC121868500 [Homarus americanus]|uniref:uncharacterized protein LOC121868500 n=1 Tax=Homarus americanus TaxID=6706 RepID=UPI001C488012|nr:uncharacterized protein LOC121868500 [Homarus americanus]
MVELGGGGPDGPIEHGFSNSVFIVAAAVLLPLVVLQTYNTNHPNRSYERAHPGSVRVCSFIDAEIFFAVKLVRTFWQRERRRHEKRKLKLERHKKK